MQTVALLVRLDMRGIDAKLVKEGSMSVMVSSMEKSIQQQVKVHHVKVRICGIKKYTYTKAITTFVFDKSSL